VVNFGGNIDRYQFVRFEPPCQDELPEDRRAVYFLRAPTLYDRAVVDGCYLTFEEADTVAGDIVDARRRDLDAQAQRAVVRGVGNAGVDEQLVPGDAADPGQPPFRQQRAQRARAKPGAPARQIVRIVDADEDIDRGDRGGHPVHDSSLMIMT